MTDEHSPAEWTAEFRGRIHPESQAWRFDAPIPIEFPDSTWLVIIADSEFRVIVKGARPADLGLFVNDVVEIVRGLVDSLGFHLGCALTLEFTGGFGVPGPNTPSVVLQRQVGWPELVDREATAALRVEAEHLAPFVHGVLGEPLVRHALSDISMAIDRPIDSAFYAHRAVESVRQYFVGDEDPKNTKPSWKLMRETLGVSFDELDALSKASMPRRHGAQLPISETERLTHAKLARRVVVAFVEHLARLAQS